MTAMVDQDALITSEVEITDMVEADSDRAIIDNRRATVVIPEIAVTEIATPEIAAVDTEMMDIETGLEIIATVVEDMAEATVTTLETITPALARTGGKIKRLQYCCKTND